MRGSPLGETGDAMEVAGVLFLVGGVVFTVGGVDVVFGCVAGETVGVVSEERRRGGVVSSVMMGCSSSC